MLCGRRFVDGCGVCGVCGRVRLALGVITNRQLCACVIVREHWTRGDGSIVHIICITAVQHASYIHILLLLYHIYVRTAVYTLT